jgi:MraZ protein
VGEVEQVFLGEYQHAIDDKGRLTIPARFRKPLLEGLVITRGLDRNLVIYPLDEWEKLVDRIDRLPYGDPKARNLRRLVFAGAGNADPDKQGRVNIPSYLLEYGDITKEVVVAGVNAYIELWSPERWESVRRGLESEENISHWARLDL